ncbi:MAG: hypothetical protein AAGA05_01005 [Pseudomonadota bacterium]
MSIGFDRADLQGNIVRGYRRDYVRHLMLEVTNHKVARIWLGKTASGGGEGIPALTTEEQWTTRPEYCFNIGLTSDGLRALRLPSQSIATFPQEFTEGMPSRCIKIGDVGASAPDQWDAPFDQPDRIHVIASIYADDDAHLDAVQALVAGAGAGQAFHILGARSGRNLADDQVHFGYRDNISQPRFKGIHDPERYPDLQPLMPLGTIILGFDTAYEGLRWTVPTPPQLGLLGSFNAFRILEQDVAGFEAFLDRAATELLDGPYADEILPESILKSFGKGETRHSAMREVIAGKMCGRWRNGVPLQESPETPNPDFEVTPSAFDYHDDERCPFGAHVRRCNPRGGPIVQRVANNTRRLVRRGIPYGGPYDPKNPDDEKRGLLGNFLCANLGAQFEAVMCDWLNLGLQDPHITGTNDPLLGANDPDESWFEFGLPSGARVRIDNLPRFVITRGGAYTFLPSLPAVRYIGDL